MLKIGITGVTGRLGHALAIAMASSDNHTLVQGLMPERHHTINQTHHEVLVSSSIDDEMDCVIDFSVAEGVPDFVTLCAAKGVPFVTGTTGLNQTQQATVEAAAQHIPIVQAPNMSIGVNVMIHLAKEAQRLLGAHDVHIIDAHRKDKRDNPSGTTLAMQNAIQSVAPEQSVETTGIRAGEIIAEVQTWFVSPHERLEIHHKAQDRALFAEGALRAAAWVQGKAPGLYSMQDVLS